MCGFTIQNEDEVCFPDRIQHRGLKMTQKIVGHFTMTHYKLPFQTQIEDDFDQPIDLGNDTYLLYNGEIFNVPVGFKNDVDYLRHYFSEPNWLSKITDPKNEYQNWDGFWAIAIVDKDGYHCFTDPLGKKQLYFRNGCLSSEIKPLLRTNALSSYFDYENVEITSLTPFQGVNRIWANSLWKYKAGPDKTKLIKKNLYDLKSGPRSSNDMEGLEDSILMATHQRLMDAGPDGVTLLVSGGLDSTILVENIRRLEMLHKVEFLTVENLNDEKYIQILENHYSIKIKRLSLPNMFDPYEIIKAYEYPLEKGSLIPQYFLCRKAKGSVIMTGDGADELFSGYKRALTEDTQKFDVFTELPYYHNVRLDRMSMTFTKELRSPFLSHEVVRQAMLIPYEMRKGKKILRDIYGPYIPEAILNRAKEPLRSDDMVRDKIKYKEELNALFTNTKFV